MIWSIDFPATFWADTSWVRGELPGGLCFCFGCSYAQGLHYDEFLVYWHFF